MRSAARINSWAITLHLVANDLTQGAQELEHVKIERWPEIERSKSVKCVGVLLDDELTLEGAGTVEGSGVLLDWPG